MDKRPNHKALVEIVDKYGGLLFAGFVRPEVARFAIEMERILKENDYKSGWDGMTHGKLFSLIKDEFEELQEEHILLMNCSTHSIRYHTSKMGKECIDIANCCMFFCHNYPQDEKLVSGEQSSSKTSHP